MSRKFANIITFTPKQSFSRFIPRIFCASLSSGIQERNCDVAVIGGGIVGTSIARKLKINHKDLQIYLLEKECSLAKHQSSHNSGVMHSGIYYKPGSLKSKFCVEGISCLQEYCDEKKIKYKKCGKLIVAKDFSEVPVLEELLRRATENKVKDLKLLESPCDIRQFASGCRGVKALWCPHTANVNFKGITQHFAQDFKDLGGTLLLNMNVVNISKSNDSTYPILIVPEDDAPIQAKYVITCGGLQSELLTKLVNEYSLSNQNFLALQVKYQKIKARYCDGVKTNIYPIPDLTLPFLGAHFSPQMDDTILLGPYAIPALKPEGYCNNEVDLAYLTKTLTSCSFRNIIVRFFGKCVDQAFKAIRAETQIQHLQELVPNFSYQFVEKGPTAVQCQLVNNDGTFVDDFVFDFFTGSGIGKRIINVKFTPSPAATSSLSISKYVADKFAEKLRHG